MSLLRLFAAGPLIAGLLSTGVAATSAALTTAPDAPAQMGVHHERDLEREIGRTLKAQGGSVAVAESCTGGLLGERITAVPGASSYFRGGVLSYTDEVKATLLGVRRETLAARGAVSAETAQQMATGVRELLGTTYGVSVTGFAGPGGGTKEAPVGTVYVAVAGPTGVAVRHLQAPGDREAVRQEAAQAALALLGKMAAR